MTADIIMYTDLLHMIHKYITLVWTVGVKTLKTAVTTDSQVLGAEQLEEGSSCSTDTG